MRRDGIKHPAEGTAALALLQDTGPCHPPVGGGGGAGGATGHRGKQVREGLRGAMVGNLRKSR